MIQNPEDFDAYGSTGKIFDNHVVFHKETGIQIAIQTEHLRDDNNIVVIQEENRENSINFADDDTIKKILKWAKLRTQDNSFIERVEHDESRIAHLYLFYKGDLY